MKYKKRIMAAAMAGIIGTMTVLPSTNVWAAWNKINGTYQMVDGSSIEGVVARGIDVSHWKQTIDWNAVAADDIQFVMLGTKYAGDVDPFFRANAVNADKAGLKVGAYVYSYATTPEMASAEADFILDLIKDYPISYPVAFDVEASVQSTLSKPQLTEIINTFCKKVEAAGYYPMLYANDYWLANKIDTSQIKYDVWVARYEVKHTYANPAMWQATSTGSVAGVQGNVDIDFQYKDLSAHLPANLWRTIGEKTYYYQDHVMQKDSWINDGSNWYYMDNGGQASKGWLTTASGKYHLDDSSGKMNTGWKKFDNDWYFFTGSGAMARGWVQDGNSRYYMNDDGVMTTGWRNESGTYYYLKDNGAMTTGWLQMDNAWYYFNPTGTMATGWTNENGSWYQLASDGKMANGWFTEGNSKYYLSTSSGRMTTGWRQIDNAWYYFNGSGAMMTGMVDVDGKAYYLDPASGQMAANVTMTIDGTEYTIDGSGVCTKAGSLPAETQTNTENPTGTPPPVEVGSAPPAAGNESVSTDGPGM